MRISVGLFPSAVTEVGSGGDEEHRRIVVSSPHLHANHLAVPV